MKWEIRVSYKAQNLGHSPKAEMLVLLFLSWAGLSTAASLAPHALVPRLRAAANTTVGEGAVQQRLVCYDSTGQYGEAHTYTDYAPYLPYMDNRIESCCFNEYGKYEYGKMIFFSAGL